eukprot:g9232.t1
MLRIRIHLHRVPSRPLRARRIRITASAMKVPFSKYHGLGNDFILIDNRKTQKPMVSADEAKSLCDRHFGIGGDGVIFALPGNSSSDFTMRIFNNDGSEPEMCGNGIRCLAKFVSEIDQRQNSKYKIDTLAGVIQPELLKNGLVRVDMGEPELDPKNVPTTLAPNSPSGDSVIKRQLEVDGDTYTITAVSMGNPHACVYSKNDQPIKIEEIKLHEIGPLFEKHEVFPARTNTEFVEVVDRDHVKMVVWERGAGPTLACGTGACALVVAGVLENRLERNCKVELPGGPLQIEWNETNNRVYMTGPAKCVFSGTFEI